jgi:predicted TIM-barrel fold metal-dependent hydrolase
MSAQRDYPIIDVDVHIHEDQAELAGFAEGSLQQALQWAPHDEFWLDAPDYSPLTVYDPPISDTPERAIHVVRTRQELRIDLDNRGIDAAIIFSGRLLNMALRPEPSYPLSVMRAYNRYVQELWLQPADGIFGAIMVVPQDPEASAREIAHYGGTPGFAAVYLPMASVDPLWGHPQYDPIYAAAEAADLPVVLHGYTQVHSVYPYQLEHVDTALAKQLLAKPFGTMANFASIVTGGALARFPRLKVVFTECGIGWLPYMLGRLDRQFTWTRAEVPFYPSEPSAHVLPHIYLTTHSLELPLSPDYLEPMLAAWNLADRLVFASDWPHFDADSVERVAGLSIPEEWKRKIFCRNALEAFRLPPISQRSSGTTSAAEATT